jgi:hypothetical protein
VFLYFEIREGEFVTFASRGKNKGLAHDCGRFLKQTSLRKRQRLESLDVGEVGIELNTGCQFTIKHSCSRVKA